MNRSLSFCLFVLVVSSMPAVNAQAVTLTIGSAEEYAGAQSITVAIAMETIDTVQVGAMQADVNYEPGAIIVKNVTAGFAAVDAGKSVSFRSLAPGKTRVIISGLNHLAIADGDLANLDLAIDKKALPATYPLVLTDVHVPDPRGVEIPSVTAIQGQIAVLEPESGCTAAVGSTTARPPNGDCMVLLFLVLGLCALSRKARYRCILHGSVLMAAVLFALLGSYSARAATLTVGQATAHDAGEEIEILVSLATGAGEEAVGLQVDISFDEQALTLRDVVPAGSAVASDKDISYTAVGVGMVRIVAAGMNMNALPSGPVAQMLFTVNVCFGSADYPIAISSSIVADEDGFELDVQNYSGVIIYMGNKVIVPDVIRVSLDAAVSALHYAGLTEGTVTWQYSSDVVEGAVIDQIPASQTVLPRNSSVALVVSHGREPLPVPDLVGMTEATACNGLLAAGLGIGSVVTRPSPNVQEGLVIAQEPASGTRVVPGTTVCLVVSAGLLPTEIPSVAGMTEDAAASTLNAAGLIVGAVSTAYDEHIPAGRVISQEPAAGIEVPPGTAVAVKLSLGPPALPAPDVVGKARAEAEIILFAAGLRPGMVEEQYSSTVAAGSVIAQIPSAGTPVVAGAAIAFTISKGQERLNVPYVAGYSVTQAQSILVTMGFRLEISEEYSDVYAKGTVITQEPAAGTAVPPETSVILLVSKGREEPSGLSCATATPGNHRASAMVDCAILLASAGATLVVRRHAPVS